MISGCGVVLECGTNNGQPGSEQDQLCDKTTREGKIWRMKASNSRLLHILWKFWGSGALIEWLEGGSAVAASDF